MIIKPLIRRSYRAGESGTLGAVCALYFDRPEHRGCPFQHVCCADNTPAKVSVSLRIINAVDAETLETMAKAIRSTMKEEARDRH
jgi:hypothetical protein